MKTVFITFSVHTTLRNLFLFPGGFFDQLKTAIKKNPKLRVVFILRPRDKEKYEALLKTASENQIAIRYVDAPSLRTPLQKIFRFFYAYLLFTDTTRILTTMGMRVEEPPAASARFLTPLRILIARTFGRSRFVRRRVVPWLFIRIFRNRPFQKIFDEFKPDLVFATHIYGDYDAFVLAEAYRRGVKTAGMPAGWDHVDKYFLPFHLGRLFVPSPQVASHAVRFQGYEKDELVITGYPNFDFLVDPKSEISRLDILSKFNLSPSSRYILYVSGSAYCPDEPDIIEKIVSWISAGEFGGEMYLVLRPYLGSRSKDRAFDEKKFARLQNHPRVIYYDEKSWDTLEDSKIFLNLMRHASVAICVYSTVFVESVIFDTPLVATPFDGYHIRPHYRSIRRFSGFEHFKEVLKTGAVSEVYSFDELKKILIEYLANPKKDTEKRERMRREVCAVLDGTASARLLSALLKEAGVIENKF